MLTKEEKFCLNGYAATRDADTAYKLSRTKPTEVKDKEILHKMALRWLRKKEVKEYLEEIYAISFHRAKEDEPAKNLRRKEDIITELNQIASSTKEPKFKAEILMKIADLQQMKKDEAKEEEKLVHFYLPLSCDRCSLYLDAKKNNRRVVKDDVNHT